MLLGGFNAEQGGLAVDVQEGLYQEILLVVDEALSYLLKCFLGLVSALLVQLDVLPGCYLALFFDAFTFFVSSNLMTISKRVILPSLAQKVFRSIPLNQKHFLNLEKLQLHILWGNHLKVAMGAKQKLLIKARGSRQADVLHYCLDAFVDFFLEVALLIRNYREMRMTHPGIYKPPVKGNSLVDAFVPCLVVLALVKFRGAISTGDHMDDGLVPSVAQLDCVPGRLIKQRLPEVFVGVGAAVHDSPVADDDRLDVGVDGDVDENVLQDHLGAHHVYLEAHSVGKGQLVSLDHCASLHEHSGCFWNDQHPEAQLRERLVESGQCGCLARARATCEADSDDGVLAGAQRLGVVQGRVFHPHLVLGALAYVARLPPVCLGFSFCLLELTILC